MDSLKLIHSYNKEQSRNEYSIYTSDDQQWVVTYDVYGKAISRANSGSFIWQVSRKITGTTYESADGLFSITSTNKVCYGELSTFIHNQEFNDGLQADEVPEKIIERLISNYDRITAWIRECKKHEPKIPKLYEIYFDGVKNFAEHTGKRISDTFGSIDFATVPPADISLIDRKVTELLDLLEPYTEKSIHNENNG